MRAISNLCLCTKKILFKTTYQFFSSKVSSTYPVSRDQRTFTNFELLARETKQNIHHIWQEYHCNLNIPTVSTSLDTESFNIINARATLSPFFVIPLIRNSGYFTLLTNYQHKSFLVTYLEDYKQKATEAPLYMAITLYDELSAKGIVLTRVDICAPASITVEDTQRVLSLLLNMYKDEDLYTYIHAFNHTPKDIDFNTLLEKFYNIPDIDLHAMSPIKDGH